MKKCHSLTTRVKKSEKNIKSLDRIKWSVWVKR